MPAALRIRKVRYNDIPQLADLHVAAWRAAYSGILSEELLANLSVTEFESIWRGILARADRTNLVVVVRGRVVGFVGFGIPSVTTAEAEIFGVYVHPDHWRSGFGRALVSAALDRLRQDGVKGVSLWVMKENRRSRGFYRASGFVPTGATRISERLKCRFAEVEYRREL